MGAVAGFFQWQLALFPLVRNMLRGFSYQSPFHLEVAIVAVTGAAIGVGISTVLKENASSRLACGAMGAFSAFATATNPHGIVQDKLSQIDPPPPAEIHLSHQNISPCYQPVEQSVQQIKIQTAQGAVYASLVA
jgi:hypothetical protein